jgi:hypothetical protein
MQTLEVAAAADGRRWVSCGVSWFLRGGEGGVLKGVGGCRGSHADTWGRSRQQAAADGGR